MDVINQQTSLGGAPAFFTSRCLEQGAIRSLHASAAIIDISGPSGPNMIGLYKDLLHKCYMSQARTGLMDYPLVI